MSTNKSKGESLVGRWISIEYEDRLSKARWYKGLVKKYDRSSDRYLIVWETGGQDWVDELKDNEYKMAKPPPQAAPSAPAPSSGAGAGSANRQQKRKRSVKEAKILVYGLPNSGKTSIINKLADQAGLGLSEEPAGPTHMFNVNRMHWNDVRLTVFDFGGKTEWRRSLWKSYFDQADALVWVVDSTDRTHLETCREELLKMLDFSVLDGVCLLLYANKLDLDQDSPLDVNEIADHLEFNNQHNKILQERLWHIQSCSAKTGDGLKDGMDWLVEKVKNPIQRDADYYYHRAAELRFLGAAGTPTFKDAEDDLVKAVEVSRLNQQGRGGQTKRAQPDSKAHRELQEELQRCQRAKDARRPRLVKS